MIVKTERVQKDQRESRRSDNSRSTESGVENIVKELSGKWKNIT